MWGFWRERWWFKRVLGEERLSQVGNCTFGDWEMRWDGGGACDVPMLALSDVVAVFEFRVGRDGG